LGILRATRIQNLFRLVDQRVALVMQGSKAAMLKITLHDSAAEFRFRLEGKLSGPWVDELRQCWETASSTTGGRRTLIDLRDVDFVDAPGEELLCDMLRRGVEFQAATPFMQSILDAVASKAGYVRVEDKSTRRSDAVLRTDSSRSHSRAL
jgi:ABC-type transporter Mla MlaB component